MEAHESTSAIAKYIELKEKALLSRIQELEQRIAALEAEREQGSGIGGAFARGVDALRRRPDAA